ncbi:MAG TPA: hypothetical protein VMV19_03925 [Xanthobacteraceae bacterium]|nr:hypothetical protein [Xanthobacteraceae bacterium]
MEIDDGELFYLIRQGQPSRCHSNFVMTALSRGNNTEAQFLLGSGTERPKKMSILKLAFKQGHCPQSGPLHRAKSAILIGCGI